MDTIKTNIVGLVKDTKTKAVINTNIEGYYAVLREREKAQEMNTIKGEIQTLKTELDNVKSLLNEISILVKR